MSFVHFRVRSNNDLSGSTVGVKPAFKAAAKMGMPALGLMDANTLSNAMSWGKAGIDAKVQPIIGCELTLQDETKRNRKVGLVIRSHEGWLNLVHLVNSLRTFDDPSAAFVKPSVLAGHTAGLMVLSGTSPHDVGPWLAFLDESFGLAFAEIQREWSVNGDRINPDRERVMLEAAGDRYPLLATNDVRFIDNTRRARFGAEVMVAVAEKRMVVNGEMPPSRHLVSPAKMRAMFADLPDALENTLHAARLVTWTERPSKPVLPPYPLEAGVTEAVEMERLCRIGLDARLSRTGPWKGYTRKDYDDRLDFEIGIINRMGFPGYFLIVADFINWAKSQGIRVGPGRGSGAGSLVAYCMGITDVDPLRYDLLFERFLNPDRVSLPDFDIDFEQERRHLVIDYVKRRYGESHVCQIGTVNGLKAKGAVRAAGRALNLSLGMVNAIAKLIPDTPGTMLDDVLKVEGPLKEEIARSGLEGADLIEAARAIEGCIQSTSTHAAGVIISGEDLTGSISLDRDDAGNDVSQYNMKAIEDGGLVKFDFLGIKTLDVIRLTESLLAERGVHLDMLEIFSAAEDPAVFAMLASGDVHGVFQLESPGMRKALKAVKPTSIEDLIALVSLYRPGPMENIGLYAAVKAGTAKPQYEHPMMAEVLDKTHGVIIYQEQVMALGVLLAGYTRAGADLLRRAMGKKIKAEMDAQLQVWINGDPAKGIPGCVANGIPAPVAEAIFAKIAKFADYGFNKSHAAAYALVAYETAWLRLYYPVEFLAANLTMERANRDKMAAFISDGMRRGIKVLPPSVNRSRHDFHVDDGCVRFGLSAINGVGSAVAQAIAEERKAGVFRGLGDFLWRMSKVDKDAVGDTPSLITSTVLTRLAAAGALDCLGVSRNKVLVNVKALNSWARSCHKSSLAGRRQISLFDVLDDGAAPVLNERRLQDAPPLPPLEAAILQFNAVGYFLENHPVSAWMDRIRQHNIQFPRSRIRMMSDFMAAAQEGTPRLSAVVAMHIHDKRVITTKKDKILSIITASGDDGIVNELMVMGFNDLAPGEMAAMTLQIDRSGEIRLRSAARLDSFMADISQPRRPDPEAKKSVTVAPNRFTDRFARRLRAEENPTSAARPGAAGLGADKRMDRPVHQGYSDDFVVENPYAPRRNDNSNLDNDIPF